MILRYTKSDGQRFEVLLTTAPITIGRSAKADVTLEDERASRLHCGIRFLDGEFLLKDLSSKNGTFLNNERIESASLHVGDRIKVGNTYISVEARGSSGASTAIEEVGSELASGKGYHTLLKEIVSKSKP
jgi:pSer/pThr/pTyr-binding forkhead associated (FHA) protein